VIAKGGPKLTKFDGSCTPIDFTKGRQPGPGICRVGLGPATGPNQTFTAQGLSLDDFVKGGLTMLDRPVINKTDITGLFDFHLTYAANPASVEPGQALAMPDLLERQLGLKLVPSTGPDKFLVIDRVERPTSGEASGQSSQGNSSGSTKLRYDVA